MKKKITKKEEMLSLRSDRFSQVCFVSLIALFFSFSLILTPVNALNSMHALNKNPKISGILEKKINENQNKSLPVIIFLDNEKKAKTTKASIANVLRLKNAKIEHVYENINAVSARIKAGEIKNIANLQGIKRIYYDINYTILPLKGETKGNFSTKLTTSTKAIGADYAWNLGYTGKNITVAVIDTGIDYTHPDLGGCFGSNCRVVDGYDFYNNSADPKDDNGHGTHVAGIIGANGSIKGVAPDVKFYALKVCDSSGSCPSSAIIAAIDWAISKNARIISMSLGASSQPNDEFGDPINIIADYAVSRGIVVVVAAGNEGPGTGTISHPGAARKVITVGASNDRGTANISDDTVSSFSNRGPSAFGRLDPELLAPGENIYSTSCCFYGSYTSMNGTSMATPHVSGAAAILLEKNPDLKPEDVRRILMQTAAPISNSHLFEQGTGIINLKNALSYNLSAIINNDDRWEVSILPGFTAFAEVRLINSGNESLNIVFSADNLTDLEGDNFISSSHFTFPSNIVLPANTTKNITISLSIPLNASPSIYGSTIKINASSQEIRIPVVVTVPLLEEGKISGSVNDDYFEFNGAIYDYGDWIYYKLYSHNGSSLKARLEWQSNADDLDLYLYSNNGELLNVSGMGSTNWEEVTLADIATKEHWIAVHAYSLSGKVNYNLTITYNSSIQVIPSLWQGEVEKNKSENITFIIKNNGNAKSNIKLNVLRLGEVKTDFSSTNIASFSWPNVWNLSSSSINYSNPKYLSARIEWQNTTNNLDLYLSYYDNGSWQYSSKYKSKHDNSVLGEAIEELRNIDIEYFIKKYGDVGLKVVNWGASNESVNISVNITDATPWDLIKVNESMINLSAGESIEITLTINASALVINQTYDAVFTLSNDANLFASVPIRFTVVRDKTPPEITIYSPRNISYNANSIALNVSANEQISSWWYSLNNGANISFTPNTTLTGLADGRYNLTVYAKDNAGNVNSTIVYFTVDTSAPDITIATPLNITYNSSSVDLNFSVKDNSSISWIGYSLDGAPNVTIAANTTLNLTKTGQHVIVLYANDTAGNMNSSEVYFSINYPFSVKNINKNINYTRIQQAIDEAGENDTIKVEAGAYNENITINKSINLIGEGADITIINASNSSSNVIEITANWVNVSGFTLIGSNVIWYSGIFLNGVDYNKISNNTIINNFNGINLTSSNNNTIKDNNITQNSNYGIFLSLSGENSIYHNNFINNTVQAYDNGNNTWDAGYPGGGKLLERF